MNRMIKYLTFIIFLQLTVFYSNIGNLQSQQVKKPVQFTYFDDQPMPELSDNIIKKGYIVFSTNYLDMIMRETIPEAQDIEQTLRVFASLGEYEPVSFAVRTIKDLQDVSVSVSQLTGPSGSVIKPDRMEIRSVRFLLELLWSRDKRMMVSPIFLEKREKINIPAKQTQPYWITIHVPDNTKPGFYHGTVTVSARNSNPTKIYLSLEVLPIQLKPLPSNFALGVYDRVRDSSDDELLFKFQQMKDHGMTTVGFAGNLGCKMIRDNKKITVEFRGQGDLERTIVAYKKVGMTGPFLWLMGNDVFNWAVKEAGGIDKPEFALYYRGVVREIIDHGKRENWPFLIIQPEDEAFGHRQVWDTFVKTMEALRPLVPEILIEADGQNAPDTSGLRSVLHLMDVLNYHNGPFLVRGRYDPAGWEKFMKELNETGKTMWFYNVDHSGYHPEVGRFSYGYELWETGVTGEFNWLLFKGGRKNPYAGANEEGYNYLYLFPETEKETGGPTTQWEAMREGIDDLKYLYTWKELAEKAKKSGNEDLVNQVKGMEVELQSWFDEIDYSKWNADPVRGRWTTTDTERKVFKGKFKMEGVWDLERYNHIRRQVAEWIINLQ